MKNKEYKIAIKIPHPGLKAELPLFFGIAFLPAYLTQGAMPPGTFDHLIYHFQIILQAALVFFMVLYLLKKSPPPEEEARSALAPALAPLKALQTLFFLLLLYGAYMGLRLFISPGAAPEGEVKLISTPWMLLPSLVTCLAAAAMEEFFFRGYCYFRLRQSGCSVLSAASAANLLFALGHLYEGPAAAGFALLSGLILSRRMLKGNSLFSLAAAHGIFNTLMLLISLIRQS